MVSVGSRESSTVALSFPVSGRSVGLLRLGWSRESDGLESPLNVHEGCRWYRAGRAVPRGCAHAPQIDWRDLFLRLHRKSRSNPASKISRRFRNHSSNRVRDHLAV